MCVCVCVYHAENSRDKLTRLGILHGFRNKKILLYCKKNSLNLFKTLNIPIIDAMQLPKNMYYSLVYATFDFQSQRSFLPL